MKKITMLLLAAFAMGSAMAQINPMEPIAPDKNVRTGKLDNGMAYYVRHNDKQKGQADFYIVHNVGAIQENDAQQGLAHFLEHMAFNGTKNLPGKQLTEYLETVGVKFGQNLNAGTGFDETTYKIKDVPTTREGIIDSALLILHDWSHFITLDPKEIDEERGVISEELRTTDGAGWRSTIDLLKALGKGSKYETRNLIGYLDGLKNFKHQELVDFYHQWYRPDYQAIVVVGDVDAAAVESKIKALMADIPAPAADASQKEIYTVDGNEDPIVSIFTDPEMPNSMVKIFIKRDALPYQAGNLVISEMFGILQEYVMTMENARMQEISMKPDAPFLGGGTQIGSILPFIPTMDVTTYIAMTQDGKIAQGFEALYTELEKVRRFGFTQSEFERAQNDLMRHAERGYANRNDRKNNEYTLAYIKSYVKNAPMPDAETEWKLDSTLIKMINVNMVNDFAKKITTPENQVIAITSPAKEGVVVPTAEELLAIRDKVIASELTAYEDTSVKEPLIAEGTALKGSPVKKTATDATLGTTEWTLANGVKVVVKPTTLKADEVRMSATAKGGLSVLTDSEYPMGDFVPAIYQFSGVGKFSATELQKQLSGKTASVMPMAEQYNSVVTGMSSPKDIETMLQLLYLTFTQPRFDENDYNRLMSLVNAQLTNFMSDPNYLAQKTFTEVAYGNNPRRQELTPEIAAKFQFNTLPGIYAKLFPNANSFTFIIVGNVDLNTLKPLVEKYIGSIPTAKKAMTFVDDKAAPVKGEVSKDFAVAMQQPKVQVRYYFSGNMPYTLKDKLALTLLKESLSSRYLISIREEKGGSYGVHVMASTDYIPQQEYDMTILFDTNDQMADELCEIVLQEIKTIAENGPKKEDVEKAREFFIKDWKNQLNQNSSWVNFIQAKYGSGLDYIGSYEQTLKSLTAADVQAMAKKMLSDGNLVKVVMRPEKTEAK